MLTAVTGTGDHVPRNRAAWDRWAAEYAGPGLCNWAQPEPSWGIWQIPEAQAGMLPAELAGRDSTELATDRLLRPYFGMHRFDWPGDESVEFHLGHGQMIRLLRRCGLEVEDLLELQPGPDATTRYPFVTLEWARQWPCEEVWKARKPAGVAGIADWTATLAISG